jgi:hypothetical protein
MGARMVPLSVLASCEDREGGCSPGCSLGPALRSYQMCDLFARSDVAFCGGGFCFIPLFWSTFEIFVDEQYTYRDDRRAGRYNMVRAVETTARDTEH